MSWVGLSKVRHQSKKSGAQCDTLNSLPLSENIADGDYKGCDVTTRQQWTCIVECDARITRTEQVSLLALDPAANEHITSGKEQRANPDKLLHRIVTLMKIRAELPTGIYASVDFGSLRVLFRSRKAQPLALFS